MNKNNDDWKVNSFLEDLLEQVYLEVPRLIQLMDNKKSSNTYGCFYPEYWQNNQNDFVNARAQEASLTLAMLYSYDFPNNPYFGNKILLDYAIAGMEYWTKLQYNDGSFDEWRKYEHGQAVTAFSTLAMMDAFKLTKNYLNENFKTRLLHCFKKAGIFLCRNPDLVCVNHEAVAVAALYRYYELFGTKAYLKKIREKVEKIIHAQFSGGGFREQYGPDSGYNTLTLSYLALYYRDSRDKTVLPTLKKALNFNSFFLYPDGFSGGGFNSRQCSMLFPLGFIILSNESELAKQLANKSLHSLVEKMDGFLTLTDIRRCITIYEVLRSYLEAVNKKLDRSLTKLPSETNDNSFIHMKDSGIIIVKNPRYYLVIGAKKGCIGAIFSYVTGTTLHLSSPCGFDCTSGIFGVTKDNLIVSNMCYQHQTTQIERGKNFVTSKLFLPLIDPATEAKWMKDRLIDKPPLLNAYHVASEIGLRYPILSFYEKFYKYPKIQRFKPVLQLIRKISWDDNKINISNKMFFIEQCSFKELYLRETFITQEALSEVMKCRNEVHFICKGKKALTMRASNPIELKLGKSANIQFNDAQPIISQISLSDKKRKLHVCFELEL